MKIRFGIIGTNWITEAFIEAAQQIDDFELCVVYSRTEERAKEFAEKHGIQHSFTDLQSFAESNLLDAVYLASPNSFHAEQAILCMNQGKHILCEKPIASNRFELQQMITAAQDNKVLLMEALKSTVQPNFKTIQQNIGKIGTVRRYFASFCQYSSRYDKYKQGEVLNAFNPTFSNGALMDLGTYCIYPLVVLFGRPKHVKANAVLLESGVDGEGSLILSYEGMEAVIMYSKITSSFLPSEIQGEDGSILIDKISHPQKVEIVYRNQEVENISQPQERSSMMGEVKEFISCIKNGQLESINNSHTNSLITMEIMDEARKQFGLRYPADIT